MILFFDEDMGTSIPKFLKGADGNVEILWLRGRFPNESDPRRQDIGWLEEAWRAGWLVVSCNKSMLKVAFERQAIVTHRVGIVFLASGRIGRLPMMRALLRKWDWLKEIDLATPRPFAYYLYASGRTRQLGL